MQVAVIGLGTIGGTIAKQVAEGGIDIIVAERNLEKAQDFGRKLGARARAMPLDQAIQTADVVILAVWFDVAKQLVAEHRRALAGKVVVDPSNPIAPDGNGGFKKTIPSDQSSGEILAGLLPQDAELVKAFGSLGGASLASAANRKPERAVLFYATDYPEAGHAVATLIKAAGFDPVPVGGIDQSIRIEVSGDLHEFGKLGRAVSEAEARALLNQQPGDAAA